MSNQTSQQPNLMDPREIYPKPPFDKQPQQAPGLGADMNPKPDHGENTYVGSNRLQGRRALITGGDSGIGRATAIAFAREGAQVTINHLKDEMEDVETLKTLMEKEGHTFHAVPGDLREREFCRALISTAQEMMGGLDILVINAGKQVFQENFSDITDEQLDSTIKTNVYAMFWLSQDALKVMPAGSSIINVSSIVGYSPSQNLIDYSTTKFAIRGFTMALAQHAINQGVRVNGVAPGPFWTPLQPSGGQSQENVHTFGKSNPMGRPGQPAEIASTFVYLASNESSYTNGEIVGVTGGMPMS